MTRISASVHGDWEKSKGSEIKAWGLKTKNERKRKLQRKKGLTRGVGTEKRALRIDLI